MRNKFPAHWTQSLRHPWVKFLFLLFPLLFHAIIDRDEGMGQTYLLWTLMLLGGLTIQRRACRLILANRHVSGQHGICFLTYRRFARKKIVVAELRRSLPLRLLGASQLRLSVFRTPLWKNGIALRRQDGDLIFRRLISPVPSQIKCQPTFRMLLVTAAVQSNRAAGFFLAIPLIRRITPYIHPWVHRISAHLPAPFRNFLTRLPAPWIIIASIFAAAWSFAFLHRLLETLNAQAFLCPGVAGIRSGFLTRRLRVFFLRHAGGAAVRQSGLMLALHIGSLWIFTGQKQPDLLLPAAREQDALWWLRRIYLSEEKHPLFTPPKHARSRYGRPEFYGLCVCVLGWGWAVYRGYILLQGCCGIICFLLCVRIILLQYTFPRVGIQVNEHCVTVCCCTGFSLWTASVPKHGITNICLRQHIFQRRKALCTVRVIASGVPPLTIKHLLLQDGIRLIRLLR